MPQVRVIVDNAINDESPLWKAFQKWLGARTAEYVFLEQAHKGIPDVEILDKLLVPGVILLTVDRALHNRACAHGALSFTLNAQGQLQKQPLRDVALPKGKTATSVIKELKDDYTSPPSALTLRLTDGMSEKDFKAYRTRRRRIRSYFGSAASLNNVAMTIGATTTKNKTLCGYVINIAGNSGVKGLRASEGYCAMSAPDYDPAYPVIHALCASFYLHLDQVPTDLFIIPEASLRLCQTLINAPAESVSQPSHRALREMLRGIARLKLFPCVKGFFYDNIMQKLRQLSNFRSNEITAVDFDAIVKKMEP